jgi:5-hydroxyisourate hydrolase
MTTLSTHVLDVEHGRPAEGVPIALYKADLPLALDETSADGRIADLTGGASLEPGSYRLVFDVAAYFARQGRPAPFLQRVSIEFQVHAGDPHYHVPLLLSAYACTSYRGS